jgi:hypothetical protein
MSDNPKGDPPEPVEEEFGTIGDLIDNVVSKTQKALFKDLSDLLDIGADNSGNPDPSKPKPNPAEPPKGDPVKASRRLTFL